MLGLMVEDSKFLVWSSYFRAEGCEVTVERSVLRIQDLGYMFQGFGL